MDKGYTFRPATMGDAHLLSYYLRTADIEELRAAHGNDVNVEEVLRNAVISSELSEVWESEGGTLLGILGVVKVPETEGIGVPWLLGTNDSRQFLRAFIEEGRKKVQKMREVTPYLFNFVDARNLASVRFLRHLGFTIRPAQPFGAQGLPFHLFEMGQRPVYVMEAGAGIFDPINQLEQETCVHV